MTNSTNTFKHRLETIPSIHYSISKIKLAQVIFKTSFENSQIITPGCLDAWIRIIRCSTIIAFGD